MGLFTYGITCSFENVAPTAAAVLRGDIDYLADTAAGLGYGALELHLANPKQYDWPKLRAVADRAGLAFSMIATGREMGENGLCLTSDDAAVRRATVDRLKEHVDMAEALGAMVGIGSIRGKFLTPERKERYVQWLTDAVCELADYAAPKNVTVLIEGMVAATSDYLNSMRQVAEFVESVGRPNFRSHLDSCIMLIEDGDTAEAIARCASSLAYVHFADCARLFPGAGQVDFKTFLRQLRKIGYAGRIVFECVPVPDSLTCAKNCIDYVRALEECIRIEESIVR